MEIIQRNYHSTISIPTREKPLFRLSYEISEQASPIKRLSNVPKGLSFLKDAFSGLTMSKSEAPKLVAEYKREYEKDKRCEYRGSLTDWALEKGYTGRAKYRCPFGRALDIRKKRKNGHNYSLAGLNTFLSLNYPQTGYFNLFKRTIFQTFQDLSIGIV